MLEEKMIKPLRDYVLLKVKKEEKVKTESGIYLPENADKEESQIGTVIAVGDNEKISVKKGEKVLYAKYSGNKLEIGNEEYRLVKNEDILAII